jgi:hypothetical protein
MMPGRVPMRVETMSFGPPFNNRCYSNDELVGWYQADICWWMCDMLYSSFSSLRYKTLLHRMKISPNLPFDFPS